jgi:hypothetical protein
VRRALVVLSLCLSGCGWISGPAPLDVKVDVWNRTLDPIFLVDQLGTRLDVPACGHASAESFRVNAYKVFTESGEWTGGQEGNVTGLPWHRFIISASRSDPIDTVTGTGPLPELPACEGHPTDFIPPLN